jgi:hypothetical protein
VATDTWLYNAPNSDASEIATLAAGTVVSIDGPPAAGFYPVTAGDLSGWLQGELLHVHKDEIEVVNGSPIDDDASAATSGAAGSDLPAGTSEPDGTSGASADLGQVGLATPVADGPGEPQIEATQDVSGTTPEGAPAPEPAVNATEPSIPLDEPGPSGPARVKADTSVRAGPGPNFDRLGRAAKGSTVEQTGHLIDGYVTVQTGDVTGWVPLDHLAPADQDETTPGA